MKDYDAYLFDWDGTIGKTIELWIAVMRKNLEQLGRQGLSDNEVAHAIGRWFELKDEFNLSDAQFKTFTDQIHSDFRRDLLDVDMYPGILDCLDRLRQKSKKLALITSNWRLAVEEMLKHHNLTDVFDIVITGDDVSSHKPDPEGIHAALEMLHIDNKKAVMLGDSEKDLAAAKNAGIDSILFYPPDHQLFYDLDFLKEHEPTRIIDSWEKIA